jgi:hypothetical protein
VVRGPAAVLGLLAAAQAYLLVAADLPEIASGDLATFVACAVGGAVVLVCVAGVVPVADVAALLVLVAIGAAALMVGLEVAKVGAGATAVEAVAYGAAGALFARMLMAPSLALALPVFVALVEVGSALAGGPGEVLTGGGATHLGDPLALELPAWGGGAAAGALGITEAVFAGVFLAYGRRYGFRHGPSAVALWAAFAAAVALKVWADTTVPVLPLMVAAWLLVNADRVPALVRLAGRD